MVTYLQDDLPTFRDASHLKIIPPQIYFFKEHYTGKFPEFRILELQNCIFNIWILCVLYLTVFFVHCTHRYVPRL